jgi:hypothetical protein
MGGSDTVVGVELTTGNWAEVETIPGKPHEESRITRAKRARILKFIFFIACLPFKTYEMY